MGKIVPIPKHKHPIVYVEHLDMTSDVGWGGIDQYDNNQEYEKCLAAHISTVGWLLRRSPNEIVIAPTIRSDGVWSNDPEEVFNPIIIPKGWVHRMIVLVNRKIVDDEETTEPAEDLEEEDSK